jgi:hypothetical protein
MVDNSIGTGRSLRREVGLARWLRLSPAAISGLLVAVYAPARKRNLGAAAPSIIHAALIAGFIVVNILFCCEVVTAFQRMPLIGNPYHSACRSLAGSTSVRIGRDLGLCENSEGHLSYTRHSE